MPNGGVLDLRTNNLEAALTFVQRQDAAGALGLYVGNNPLDVQVGGPDKNRPNNQSVAARVSLFLDLDRAGKPKHLATHEELATIHEARQYAQDFLATHLGFPVEASRSGVSGNGEYLIYALDHLPSSDETNSLIHRATRALRTILAAKYPTVHLDAVHEPVRVRRISGTINRKHDEHRMCRLDVHDQAPVTRAMLEALAALAPVENRIISTRPMALTLSDQDIIDRLHREKNGQGIGPPLLAGDKSGYSDYSSARYALAGKLYWEHADEEQIARILRTSDLFNESDNDRERNRKAAQDARKRVSESGPQRDPNYNRPPISRTIIPEAPSTPPIEDANLDAMTMAEMRSALRASWQREAAKDETIRVQAEIIDSITTILASDQIEAGPRLTSIGVLLIGLEKRAKGERPTEFGYHMPASWIARKTGQTPKTISTHLRVLAGDPEENKPGVIDRNVRPGKVQLRDEVIDRSTGEVWTETREKNGKRNYIALPDNVIDYATRIAGHTRTEEEEKAKHGGARVQCTDCGPDAGTYTEHVTRCRQCKKVLDERTTYSGPPIGTVIQINDHDGYGVPEGNTPDESTPKMGMPIVTPPEERSTPKMGIDSNPERKDLSGILPDSPPPVVDRRSEQAEPAWMWESPPDDPGPPPDWQETNARTYGRLYRGEEAS